MFDEYLRKIIPVPLVDIKVSQDGYKYLITTYASVLSEFGVASRIERRLKINKRIKSFKGWWLKDNECFYKQAIVEFKK